MSPDDIRTKYPSIGFAIYAMEPGAPVTLETYAKGQIFTFRGATVQEAIDKAFPPEPSVEDEASQPAVSVFD